MKKNDTNSNGKEIIIKNKKILTRTYWKSNSNYLPYNELK